MSDMETQRHVGAVLIRTLVFGTLVGLCWAAHRPDAGPPSARHLRHPRHHDRRTQRIEYPSPRDQGAQQVAFPSLDGEAGEWLGDSWLSSVQSFLFPSANDNTASSPIQKCSPGYYRETGGLAQGRCVRCQCNELAEECEDGTGKCLDCQHNTAGDQCERCKEGYYGSATHRTCKVCPCPFTTAASSFAIGCTEAFGDIRCICRLGYAGERCESCAPGYYGDPLTLGGSCRRCNCYGNNCHPKTGVCKNTLEPGDTNTDDTCRECDNCAQTLLHDLEKLDNELKRIKAQMDNATASASSQERLKKLEEAVLDTKNLLKKYSTAVNTQKNRVNQVEEDMITLEDDVNTLQNKADKKESDANKALADVQRTHNRAQDLDLEIRNMLKKIQALVDQLNSEGNRGDTPNHNFAKLLEDAKKMVDEMEAKDFAPQKTAAEKERDEAKKLLDSVKDTVTKQSKQNEDAAQKIKGLLDGYQAKLKDLDQALKEATDSVKKANTQNGLNTQSLGDMQKRIADLTKEKKTVEEQMKLAEDELKKTDALGKTLKDSKKAYEQLAAQLDGAKTDLTKKVNDITKAAGKEDLVESAEDHAKMLQELAKKLQDTVTSASDRPEVRNAKDAIDAYKNITDAIDAAAAAAKEAKAAADQALNNINKEKLPDRAEHLKEAADDLLKNAEGAQQELQDGAKKVPDLQKRLTDADSKKAALEKELQDAVKQLKDVKRDDIGNVIDEAKRKSSAANDSASDTMSRLSDIRKELDKIHVTPGGSNLDGVLDEVDQSVKNLWQSIPTLGDKIAVLETLTTKITPFTNISENIKKIKELIEHARDAANKITIPMNFLGDGHVELRAPQNLEDLKAYTALSLSLQRPSGRGDGRRRRRQSPEKENFFVMYLGHKDPSKNYIGLALRNNVLFGVYKLNGVEYEMKTGYITKSDNEPAKFDRVDLRRIYQDAEISLTKDVTSPTHGEPLFSRNQGEESKNLLDLSPSDVVFYVGGYPDTFTPPPSLNYPKYKGCMEFGSFNDRVISLYNFQNAVNINAETPCKRYALPREDLFFEGTGFGRVNIASRPGVLFIAMTIKSLSENGLLLYLGSEDKYFAVTIEKGVFFVRSNKLAAPVSGQKKSFPMPNWTEVQLILRSFGELRVRMTSMDVIKTSAEFKLDEFKEFYIGGVPQQLRERYHITMQPFKGCLNNLKVNNIFKLIDEDVGISKGCPPQALVSRKAELSLDSSLAADLSDFTLDNDVTVSIGFKSTEQEGLILQDKKLSNGIKIEVQDGHVLLSLNNKAFRSSSQYHDGRWHYVTVTRRAGKVKMLIDDQDEGEEQPAGANIPNTAGLIQLGQRKFKGCLSNLYTRRPSHLYRAEDLSTFQSSGEVLIDSCAADSVAQLMMDRPQNNKR